jgi:capsular exopolysaccharide synthesis family protein
MDRASPELVTAYGENSPFAEAYRVLQFKLFPRNGARLRSLGVTGVAPNHGSTTTAANLGLIVAESGIRVILVDADLHKPSLHRHFELSNDVGLSTVLRGEISLDRALQGVKEPSTLQVLAAGPAVSNPAALLQSEVIGTIFDSLRESSHILIVDMPSVGAVAYTSFLASFLDGLLLVVRAGTSPVSADRIVKDRLQGVNVIGMVLNQVPVNGSEISSHRHYARSGG